MLDNILNKHLLTNVDEKIAFQDFRKI